jgi:uncharacterized protein YbaP (TraB family)
MLLSYTCVRRKSAGLLPRFICLFLLVLLVAPVISQAQHSKRAGYQLLWRIEGPGISSPSYLFGTMHLTERRVFEFSDSVLVAFRSADAFAMEIDMDSAMTYMLAPGGPLQDTTNFMRRLFTAEEYQFVDSLVKKKSGVRIAQLNLKRLWFIEKLLQEEQEVINKTAGSGAKAENVFLDGWLHQKATFLGKPIHSLERLTNQLAFMSADVSEVQKDIFLESIGYKATDTDRPGDAEIFDARVKFLDSLVNLYYAGNPESIYNLVGKSAGASHGPGLVKRNIEMADNLATLVRSKSIFAAVGAAHLSGDTGLITLLRAKGFSVNPVTATFTGMAKRERQRLDSVKGYTMNRMSDGYSVVFPGVPVAYPIPGMNRKMYVATNDNEASFAFSMDLPQLAKDQQELGDMIIANMAAQGKATLQRSYPIVYRDMPGTEAIMMQGKTPFYLRLFMRSNRAFVFMYATDAADSTSRVDFFKSVRFYDIVRAASVYDSLYRPELGFSAIMPSDANHIKANHPGEARPVEAYTALDDANHISYVLRVEKMKPGYYNMDDAAALVGIRSVLLKQDTTIQLVDSVVTKMDGYTVFRMMYSHKSGFTSRMHLISRGNLAYTLLCTYDAKNTDSTYWKRFLEEFKVLPLTAQEISVPFTAPDSSFSVKGPEKFVPFVSASSLENEIYTAMDTTSFASYIITISRYPRYYDEEPDSLLKSFLHSEDSSAIEMNQHKSVVNGVSVYDNELKLVKTSLRAYRRAVVAGHTIYGLTAVVPEEVVAAGQYKQFFASFHPGRKELADTLRLEKKKLTALLADLQSSDTAVFNGAAVYVPNLHPDSLDKAVMLDALTKPFPADTNGYWRAQLLVTLENLEGDDLVNAAEKVFGSVKDTSMKILVLNFLSDLSTDSAINTFIRLAPQLPEQNEIDATTFTYTMTDGELYEKYLPLIISTAGKSGSFLQQFVSHSSEDSLWMAPRFAKYGLESLVPGMTQLYERQLKALDACRGDDARQTVWLDRVQATGRILASPGLNVPAAQLFSRLLTDSIASLRALGARGLMNHSIRVNDKVLKGILADYSVAYTFIDQINSDQQMTQLNHLLTQELVGRVRIGFFLMSDYADKSSLEYVNHVKVDYEKNPTVWLNLYRYKDMESGDWVYLFNGPQPLDEKKFNTSPDLYYRIDDADKVKNRKELAAEAVKAYKEYLEEPEEEEEGE